MASATISQSTPYGTKSLTISMEEGPTGGLRVIVSPKENVCLFDSGSVIDLLAGVARTYVTETGHDPAIDEDTWASLFYYNDLAPYCPVSYETGFTTVAFIFPDTQLMPNSADSVEEYGVSAAGSFSGFSEDAEIADEGSGVTSSLTVVGTPDDSPDFAIGISGDTIMIAGSSSQAVGSSDPMKVLSDLSELASETLVAASEKPDVVSETASSDEPLSTDNAVVASVSHDDFHAVI